MALIYRYLQDRHGYQFTIVKSEDDVYEDHSFKVVSIPRSVWQPIPRTPFFVPSVRRSCHIRRLFTKADAVLTVDPMSYPQGLLAIKVASKLDIPVWFDSSVTLMGQGRSFRVRLARSIVKPALYRTNGIIVTVPKCIERFQDLNLFDERIAAKFRVMGHPVDCSAFCPSEKTSERDGILRVMAVTRLVPEKGLYYILEAMQPILAARDDVMLQILGAGPMKGLMEYEVAQRGLKEKVQFLAPVKHMELPAILAKADIFVNHAVGTSTWEEFFGAVNLEAMACGLPCVLSTNGGITYAVRDGNSALLVSERDVMGMNRAINELVGNALLRKEMGERARNYVIGKYDITVIGEKYRQMLETENTK